MDTTNIFTITPMAHDIDLDPGQEYNGEITVANPANASEDFSYQVEISPYAVVGDEYSIDFLTESARSQVIDWITIENPKGTLKPNETADVKFTIKVPENAPAGGQYATLLVSSDANRESGEGILVNNIYEMASIIYLNIKGEVVHGGEVIDNTIPGFVTKTPIKTSATLTNTGTTHEIARMNLEVKSVFSATPIYPKDGESGVVNEVIMPETSRYVTRDITDVSPLGIYEVTQTINYLGESHQIKQTVVACPIWFMVLVLITVTAIVTAVIHKIKTHRRKRRVL